MDCNYDGPGTAAWACTRSCWAYRMDSKSGLHTHDLRTKAATLAAVVLLVVKSNIRNPECHDATFLGQSNEAVSLLELIEAAGMNFVHFTFLLLCFVSGVPTTTCPAQPFQARKKLLKNQYNNFQTHSNRTRHLWFGRHSLYRQTTGASRSATSNSSIIHHVIRICEPVSPVHLHAMSRNKRKSTEMP